jgi:hypothetical protein
MERANGNGKAAENKLKALHMYKGKKIKNEAVRGMCEATVHATLATNLTLYQMTTVEKGHEAYMTPRTTQARAAKQMIGTSTRVSPHITLMEAGWILIDADIIAAKLRLMEQLKMQPQGSYTKQVVTERMKQVLQGDTKGIEYETYKLWEEIGLQTNPQTCKEKDYPQKRETRSNKRL